MDVVGLEKAGNLSAIVTVSILLGRRHGTKRLPGSNKFIRTWWAASIVAVF